MTLLLWLTLAAPPSGIALPPLRLERPEDFAPEEVQALRDGLDALPPPLREVPGGEIVVRRRHTESELGLGGWADATHHVFLLDDFAPGEDARAALRTARLTPRQLEALWRRRAAVHMVVQRWDDARRWSARPAWRRLNGWLAALERPTVWRERALNVFPGAYSREAGMRSASLDFVTLAEEVFAPPGAVQPGAVPVDESVRCQERSKSRVLFRLLDDESLLGAHRDALLARPACPAFDAWAGFDSLSHVEALFVAASGRAPESLFGHVLLRLVRKDSAERVTGPSFGTAIQLVALTGADAPDGRYLVRGLTGGYAMGVMTATWGDVARTALEDEQRSIRRFRLVLSQDELARFVERVWELERRGYFEYWFLTDNCAALLGFVLEAALDDGRQTGVPHGPGPVLPASVVDALVREGVAVPMPGRFESMRDRALAAEADRQRLEQLLRAHVGGSVRDELEHGLTRVHDARLPVRETGVTRLQALTGRLAGRGDETLDRALYGWWMATVRIERYAVERAEAKAREALLASITRDAVRFPSAEEVVAQRQREFAHEDDVSRRLAALDRLALGEAQLEHAPRRPLRDDEQAAVAEASALATGFRRLTSVQGELVDRYFGDVDARAMLGAEAAARATREASSQRMALPGSGYARWAPGVFAGGDGAGISLFAAALDEDVGDQRLTGYQPSTRLRILSGEVRLDTSRGWPRLRRSEMTLVAYRTLQAEVATLRHAPWDALGWGAQWTYDVHASRALAERSMLSADTYVVLDATPDFTRHLAVGFGVHGQTRWASSAQQWLGGPSAVLTARLPLFGTLTDCLRLEARYLVAFDASGARTDEAVARASVDVLVPLGARGVLLRPAVDARWVGGSAERAREVSLSFASEWL